MRASVYLCSTGKTCVCVCVCLCLCVCVCVCAQVRYLVLTSGKTLLTPQPRLRTGFFSTLRLEDFTKV